MATIEIWDGSRVQLADLLERLPMIDELNWAVLEMWAVGRNDDIDVVALERHAEESPTGLALSGTELRQLASQLLQLIDGIVVGYRSHPPKKTDPDLGSTAEVVVEAIDSTLWRIYARDEGTIERLRVHYSDVREVVPEVAIPAVHGES